MKKITAIAVLVTVISSAAFASVGPLGENSKFKIIEKSDVKYELVYVSDIASDVVVTIYDKNGKNIDSNRIKDATKFKRTYDFSQLEPGTYKIVVKNKEGIANEEISFSKEKTTLLKTFVSKMPDANAVKLHVGQFNHEEPVYVKIYDQDNRVIHKDQISKASYFSRVYNLAKFDSDYVTVRVENDGEVKTFTHTLKQ